MVRQELWLRASSQLHDQRIIYNHFQCLLYMLVYTHEFPFFLLALCRRIPLTSSLSIPLVLRIKNCKPKLERFEWSTSEYNTDNFERFGDWSRSCRIVEFRQEFVGVGFANKAQFDVATRRGNNFRNEKLETSFKMKWYEMRRFSRMHS